MAQSKAPKTAEFDSIVIGAGLAGLLAAEQLEATGRRVAVVEAHDYLGGESRSFQNALGTFDQGLKFLPATPNSKDQIDWLETQLGLTLKRQLVEAPPVTFDSGRLQPFVGFGDVETAAASELHYFLTPQFWRLEPSVKDWSSLLSERLTGAVFQQSQVTKILAEDQFVVEVVLNGAKRLTASEYFFCATPTQLNKLLPEGFVTPKSRQKLLKGNIYSAIHLDLFHSAVITDNPAIHVLRGANEEPSIGQFLPPQVSGDGQTIQVSQWLTFVRQELVEDTELVATALKRIKRQVKRAYEPALSNLSFERILVSAPGYGEIPGLLSEQGQWPKLENLWLLGSQYGAEPGFWGLLQQMRQVLDPILAAPAPREVDDAEGTPRPVVEA